MKKKQLYIKPETEELLSGPECILCVSGDMSGGVNWGDGSTNDEDIDKDDEESGGPV